MAKWLSTVLVLAKFKIDDLNPYHHRHVCIIIKVQLMIYTKFIKLNLAKISHYTVIAERLSARQLILLRISFCVGMFVCPSRLGMLISVHCARALVFPGLLHVRGRAQRIWPHYCRERQELIGCQGTTRPYGRHG